MKARIVAWNGPSQEYRDNTGFKALNDFKYGPLHDIEESNAVVAEELGEEFDTLYPDFNYNHMQLVTEEDEKAR